MDAISLKATPRTAGKGAARAARRNQEVPCVLYGAGVTDNVLFQVPELALRPLIYTAEKHVAEIDVDGKTYNAILKTVTMHPVTDRPYHADFLALKRGEKVKMTVPLHFIGQAPATRTGLVLATSRHDVEIEVLPRHIPGFIEVSLEGLKGTEDAIRVANLTLPEGVEVLTGSDEIVVAVIPPRTQADLETVESGDQGHPPAPETEAEESGEEG
ncbi:MAG: 50S ribosomal protein L25 [Rhodothermales bacterium]|nr:50S ribosomal protein L25 [Rhodothermales bacterium]